MRSVRCERCGFVQAERPRCRKCGRELSPHVAEPETRAPAPVKMVPPQPIAFDRASPEHVNLVETESAESEPIAATTEERPALQVGESHRVGSGAVGWSSPRTDRYHLEPVRPPVPEVAPPPPPPRPAIDVPKQPAMAEKRTGDATKDAKEKSGPPKPKQKQKPEPIVRIRSMPLTVDVEAPGAVLVEFRCRKCDHYGVLAVPVDLMEKGIEGECGSCRKATPLTRAELARKRMDLREP